MSAKEKIIEAIKGFNWGNYSLDEVEMGLADYPDQQDWVEALADAVCAAIDDQPFHTIDLREDGWTLKHQPVRCRPGCASAAVGARDRRSTRSTAATTCSAARSTLRRERWTARRRAGPASTGWTSTGAAGSSSVIGL